MLLSQYNMTQIVALLVQNPGLAVFPFYTSDYPNGVTRAALVAQFKALLGPTNSGNFDSATGKWNCQVYAPGILVAEGEQVVGGLQNSNTYAANPVGLTAPSLPTTAGANILGGSQTSNTSTGTVGNNTGEFSPPGDAGAVNVVPITPVVAPGAAFGSDNDMLNLPSQVQ